MGCFGYLWLCFLWLGFRGEGLRFWVRLFWWGLFLQIVNICNLTFILICPNPPIAGKDQKGIKHGQNVLIRVRREGENFPFLVVVPNSDMEVCSHNKTIGSHPCQLLNLLTIMNIAIQLIFWVVFVDEQLLKVGIASHADDVRWGFLADWNRVGRALGRCDLVPG